MRPPYLLAVAALAVTATTAACGGGSGVSSGSLTEDDLAGIMRGDEDAPRGMRLVEGASEPRPAREIAGALGVGQRRLEALGFSGARDESFMTNDESDGVFGLVFLVRGDAESADALERFRSKLVAERDTPALDDALDLEPLSQAVLGEESYGYAQLNGDVTEGTFYLWRRANAVFFVQAGAGGAGLEFSRGLDDRASSIG